MAHRVVYQVALGLIVCAGLIGCSSSGSLLSTPSAVLAVGSATGAPGEVVRVPVTLTNATGATGLSLTIRVDDPEIAVPTDAVLGAAMAGGSIHGARDEESGRITVTVDRTVGLPPGVADVLTLLFRLVLDVEPGACTRLLIERNTVVHGEPAATTTASVQAGQLCAEE